MRVAVDGGLVGGGLDLLWLLGAEGIGSALPHVHVQLQEDLQRALQLRLTVGRQTDQYGRSV